MASLWFKGAHRATSPAAADLEPSCDLSESEDSPPPDVLVSPSACLAGLVGGLEELGAGRGLCLWGTVCGRQEGPGGDGASHGGRLAGQASAALLGFLGFHSSIILIPPTHSLLAPRAVSH